MVKSHLELSPQKNVNLFYYYWDKQTNKLCSATFQNYRNNGNNDFIISDYSSFSYFSFPSFLIIQLWNIRSLKCHCPLVSNYPIVPTNFILCRLFYLLHSLVSIYLRKCQKLSERCSIACSRFLNSSKHSCTLTFKCKTFIFLFFPGIGTMII